MPKEGEVTSQEALDGAAGLIDTTDLQTGAAAPQTNEGAPASNASTDQPAQSQANQPQVGNNNQGSVEPIKVETTFGTSTYGEGETVLSSWDDVAAYAKDQGIDLEKVDDLQGVITELNLLKAQVANVPQLEQAIATYDQQIKSLPKEVAAITDAALKGEDYIGLIKQVATGIDFDLTKHFKDQDVLSLVGRYNNRSFTKEVFDEMDASTRDGLIAIAETKYNDEQKSYTDNVLNSTKNQEAFEKSFIDSVNTSMDNLKKRFPSFKPDDLKKVEDILRVGLKDNYFNPDNTYKEDAAIRIAMSEYGESALQVQAQTIGDFVAKARSEMEGQTNENLVHRSNVPENRGRQANASENVVEKAVNEATDFLTTK